VARAGSADREAADVDWRPKAIRPAGRHLMRGLTNPVEAHAPNLAVYAAMATLMAARAAAAFSNPRVSVWVPSRSL
jgi:hypothetical protein